MEAIDVEANNNNDPRFVLPTDVFSSQADLSDLFGTHTRRIRAAVCSQR